MTIAGALLINFGYLIAMETLTRGRTVGAFALGLRVVRDDGGAIRFRQALLRGLAFWGVDFAIWTGFCGGLVCAAVNPMSKRFGDLMAGTIVIRTRTPRPPVAHSPIPAGVPGCGGRRAEPARAVQDPPAVGARRRGASCRLAVTPSGRSSTLRGWTQGVVGH